MRLKDGVIFTQVADETIVVTVGEAANVFRGMVKLNATGAFIGQNMQKDFEIADLVVALQKEYEVDEETAAKAAESVVEKFRSIGLINE